jgi:CDP-glycerol glycerophosphotransferase
LHNLEVVVVDDGSTDDTPEVAKKLCARDHRVRYVRLSENSGGCSVPRNAGIEAAQAPHLMFLDSDDELLFNGCNSLLRVVEAHDIDFAAAMVERYFEDSGRTAYWYPRLFQRFQVIDNIRSVPEMLFDILSTNKIYRTRFIDRVGLRFPEGVHYEDQLVSTKAYCLAKQFAIVPWAVYRWRHAGHGSSISTSRHNIDSISSRIAVNKLIDQFFAESGDSDLQQEKDYRFLKHDFRLYLGDLRLHDVEWVQQFIERSVPYLNRISDGVYERLNRSEQICLQLLREGRAAEAIQASWTLGATVPATTGDHLGRCSLLLGSRNPS